MPLVAESAPQGLCQVLLPRAFALQRDGFDVGTTKLAAQEGVWTRLSRSINARHACQVSAHIHREAISRIGLFAGTFGVRCFFSVRAFVLTGPQQAGLESGPLPDWPKPEEI